MRCTVVPSRHMVIRSAAQAYIIRRTRARPPGDDHILQGEGAERGMALISHDFDHALTQPTSQGNIVRGRSVTGDLPEIGVLEDV
jgi:hypothetical protein